MKIRFPSHKNQTLIFKSHHSEKTIPRTVQCCASTFDLKGKSVAERSSGSAFPWAYLSLLVFVQSVCLLRKAMRKPEKSKTSIFQGKMDLAKSSRVSYEWKRQKDHLAQHFLGLTFLCSSLFNVIGLGKSGRAATKLALARGASVIAIDQNENLSLLELNPLFEKHGHLKTVLGHFDTKLLKDADMVVVSPGVPLESHGLSFLLQSGKRVLSELDFAAEILPRSIKILAVTGTNGKSTVATFSGQVL
ncbi:UDP-N-acetylmuramoylalanine--D-glutamate ligase [Vitis vinifera]|uniref:UDP-N-acetylmuramoylalanine--D-glutamate ligase n=1 Tax=Vitis vinifera TaxID=29760 RepID=A0A438JL08_VITVI|nr:UDP-N-acetylmuramoylalanine--D-glutamate ligase [Vitis vinifera]